LLFNTPGRSVCRDYAHLAVPFCRCPEHPAALLHWVLTDIGLTDGFCRVD